MNIYAYVCIYTYAYVYTYVYLYMASQVVLMVRSPFASARDIPDVGSIPGSGRSPG